MPNVSKETLELIKTVAILEERLDAIRSEILDLQKQLSSQEQNRGKLWDRFWIVAAAVLGAIVGSTVTGLLTYYLITQKG